MTVMDLTDLGQGAACAVPEGASLAEPRLESPFVLIEPLRRTAPLIFASPHSGRRYPAELLADSRVALISLRRSEDAYVDELFAGAAAHGAAVLSATVARAYVDLNRDPAELDPDMFDERPPQSPQGSSARVQAGLGAIPRVSGDGQTIYRRKLSLGEAERRIAAVHRPYHAMLQNLVTETREAFGCTVLVDCHSMPSSSRGAHAPDIVLGDRFDFAPLRLSRRAQRAVRRRTHDANLRPPRRRPSCFANRDQPRALYRRTHARTHQRLYPRPRRHESVSGSAQRRCAAQELGLITPSARSYTGPRHTRHPRVIC
jgi:N-formylglutamate amidohydrolase